MAEWVGIGRRARRCYGFDEIALAPGEVTVNPDEVDSSWKFGGKKFSIPILAAAMDGVVGVDFAVEMSKLGGVAVLNLDGVQTRYENPDQILKEISEATPEAATALIQKAYTAKIKENLIAKRVSEIKNAGGYAAVSCIPQNANRFSKIAEDAGADCFVVQSTVTTAKHIANAYKPLNLYSFCKEKNIPVIIGNCVTYKVTLDLLATGCAGILVGVGPGAACTTRGVLGIGVPQVTSTIDCAAARDFYFRKTGKFVPIITDGGMSKGGDICKAFASGADAVMIGSAFTRAKEAPGRGYHWGMATSHSNLPRGTRIKTGISGTLKQILFGPAVVDDGSQNLMGALATSMGSLGAKTLDEMHFVEIIIAPSIQTEGKVFQATQRVGMGK
ncbi:MAG: GuaB3 family IMP dehydrogenase-related protein [Candidatus Omnitrophica bacterium]|nr:GuaB3 family IMP dehydrogenase-related protein [Candidatus Omnitrophota bacterium]MCF7893173.1 GuaB3 family IMP dehydrogenase-related protein [Candidatus Omnitrophota bacterium]